MFSFLNLFLHPPTTVPPASVLEGSCIEGCGFQEGSRSELDILSDERMERNMEVMSGDVETSRYQGWVGVGKMSI